MSDRKATLTFAVSVAFLIPGLLSFAQAPAGPNTLPFKIKAIRQRLVAPPDYQSTISGSGGRSFTVGDKWLRIETELDSASDWADDVQLKYCVLMGKGRDARLFAGEVTYLNVAKGLRHVSAMFIHPNTVQRYGNGQVEAVAVQLFYKGRLVDQDSSPATSDRWWERYTPVNGYRLNPQQTP
jgi:hypothetical protein